MKTVKFAIWLLFGFRGRLSLVPYICLAIPLCAATMTMEHLIYGRTGDDDGLPAVQILVPLCACYWIYAALVCKRLHDFGVLGSVAPIMALVMSYRAVSLYVPELMLGEGDIAQEQSWHLLHGMYVATRWLMRLAGGACFIKAGDALDNVYGPPFGTRTPEQERERNARREQNLRAELGLAPLTIAVRPDRLSHVRSRRTTTTNATAPDEPRTPRPRREGGFGRRTA